MKKLKFSFYSILHMDYQIFIVDAFTDKPFKGNQAGVCLIQEDLKTVNLQTLQDIAFEMNLAETAFLSPLNSQDSFTEAQEFNLKWFTPATEIDLCGHATLASAHVLFNELHNIQTKVIFHTLSGPLTVNIEGDKLVMDFPKNTSHETTPIASIASNLSLQTEDIVTWEYEPVLRNLLIEVKSEEVLRQIHPNFGALTELSYGQEIVGVIVTTKMEHSSFDFASRYIAPWVGINEDPVTGSSHTTLGPYWQHKLNKNDLQAVQLSKRTGAMRVVMQGTRVLLYGKAITTLQGSIKL